MSKKLRCNVTGVLYYKTDKHYAKLIAKHGSEEALKANYVSMLGKKIQEGSEEMRARHNNRITCTVTGRSCYISKARIKAGIEKYKSWDAFAKTYICRSAKRLIRDGVSLDDIKQLEAEGRLD